MYYYYRPGTIIDVTDNSVTPKPPKPWLPALGLIDVDKECLLSPVGWITDSVMNAVQQLLQQQFPSVNGLQSVTLGLVCNFNIIQGDFIQILHSPGHWITASTIGLSYPSVAIMDSLYDTLSRSVGCQLATILCTEHKSIPVEFMDVQRQVFHCHTLYIHLNCIVYVFSIEWE